MNGLELEHREQPEEPRRSRDRSPQVLHDSSQMLANLQRDAGNQAIQQLLRSGQIQGKLTIGAIDDPAEREADHVAETIMRSHAGGPASSPCSCSGDGEMCEECQQKQSQPAIQRRAAAPSVSTHVPGIVSDVLRSSGHPLDAPTRAFFEPRFGQDFSHVRVHTGQEAAASAQSIQAHAYTAGSDIVFDQGQFSPHSTQGRGLLAHELTHVIQQRGPELTDQTFSAGTSRSFIQRSPGPKGKLILPPTSFSDESKSERSKWRAAVDKAVRKQFKLTGAGIADSQVSYVSPQDFGSLFKGKDLEDALLTTFLDTNNVDAQNILLSDTRVAYLASDRYWPSATGMSFLTDFIREGIGKNSFTEGPGGPLDVNTGKPVHAASTITPGELLATEFAGLTTSTGPRSARHISLRNETPGEGPGVFVQVFVHEACHFYGKDAYQQMIGKIKNPDDPIGGARIGQILAEGVPEFFAREVTVANGEEFGDVMQSYQPEFEQAARLIDLVGEDTVKNAYFGGNTKDLQTIVSVMENARNDKIPDPINAEKLFEPSQK
jgi:hypothetical protein